MPAWYPSRTARGLDADPADRLLQERALRLRPGHEVALRQLRVRAARRDPREGDGQGVRGPRVGVGSSAPRHEGHALRERRADHSRAGSPATGRRPEGLINAHYLSMTQPFSAGGLVSTVDDLARWQAALDSGAILSAESRRRMWTPVTLPDGTKTRYGFGWGIWSYEGHAVVEHGGRHQRLRDGQPAPARRPRLRGRALQLRRLRRGRALSGFARPRCSSAGPSTTGRRSRSPLATLDRYAGTYRDEDGDDWVVHRSGDHLAIAAGPSDGRPGRSPPTPSSFRDAVRTFRFVRDAGGAVVALEIDEGNGPRDAGDAPAEDRLRTGALLSASVSAASPSASPPAFRRRACSRARGASPRPASSRSGRAGTPSGAGPTSAVGSILRDSGSPTIRPQRAWSQARALSPRAIRRRRPSAAASSEENELFFDFGVFIDGLLRAAPAAGVSLRRGRVGRLRRPCAPFRGASRPSRCRRGASGRRGRRRAARA